MQLPGRIAWALAVSAFLVISCNLNPQPEPPSALENGGSDDSAGGAGGGPGSTTGGSESEPSVSVGGDTWAIGNTGGSAADRDRPDGSAPTGVVDGAGLDAGMDAGLGDSGPHAGSNADASDAAEDDSEAD